MGTFQSNIIDNSNTITTATGTKKLGLNANTHVEFGTDTHDWVVGGTSVLDITSAGTRLGGGGVRVSTIIDSNTMTGANSTNIPSSLSVKVYRDNQGSIANNWIAHANNPMDFSLVTAAHTEPNTFFDGCTEILVFGINVSTATTYNWVVRLGDSSGIYNGSTDYKPMNGQGGTGTNSWYLHSIGTATYNPTIFTLLRRMGGNRWFQMYGNEGTVDGSPSGRGHFLEMSGEPTQIAFSSTGTFDGGTVYVYYR